MESPQTLTGVTGQFAKAGGAKVVATTSSPAKFELLKRIGADHVISYREDPDWGTTARRLTPNSEGFDNILDVGASGTMAQGLRAVKYEGIITVIGALSAPEVPTETVFEALQHICTLRGILVGSRALMEDMMAAMEANKIQPVVDKHVFALDELKQSLEYMVSVPPSWRLSAIFATPETEHRVDKMLTGLYRKLNDMWERF